MVWTRVTRTFFGGIERATSVFGPHPVKAAEKKTPINANFRIGCEAVWETSVTSIRAFCSTPVAFCRDLAPKNPLTIVIEVLKVAAAAKLIWGKMRILRGYWRQKTAGSHHP